VPTPRRAQRAALISYGSIRQCCEVIRGHAGHVLPAPEAAHAREGLRCGVVAPERADRAAMREAHPWPGGRDWDNWGARKSAALLCLATVLIAGPDQCSSSARRGARACSERASERQRLETPSNPSQPTAVGLQPVRGWRPCYCTLLLYRPALARTADRIRAADLAHRSRAHYAVVAVGVVGGVPAELVPGQLGGLLVVRGDLLAGGSGRRGARVPAACGVSAGSTDIRWR
jgi:hypothetical protein